MGRVVWIVFIVAFLLFQSAMVYASEGQVLQVINGDTFRMEVEKSKGAKTVEVNLRCSDAPILSSPFGKESKQYLERLLGGANSVNFKIQAYCGPENCVEVLAYIPSPSTSEISYINTQMIAAGMARNDSCRGIFKEAEDQAKKQKKGIWSSSKSIVYSETKKVPVAADTTTSSRTPVAQATRTLTPAAKIEVDRAERTVTLKSREMSLSRAIYAIDSVSTQPVSLYQFEDLTIAVNMEKAPWYQALQQIIQLANLKQVNMNGKIDLYGQAFYYQHISPYMKLSDNDGAHINVASGSKNRSVADDGVTRYVFINDFENSAEATRLQEEKQSSFVQIHKNGSQAPISNDGRFEVSKVKEPPVSIPDTVPAPPVLSGTQPAVVEQPVVATEQADVKPKDAQLVTEISIEKEVEPLAAVSSSITQKEQKAIDTKPSVPSGQATAAAVAKAPESASDASQVDYVQLGVLLVVILVVIFGSIYLSRSAGERAAKAEKSVASSLPGQPSSVVDSDSESVIDDAYEQDVFNDLDQVTATDEADSVVEEIFRPETSAPVGDAVPFEQAPDVQEPAAEEQEPVGQREKPGQAGPVVSQSEQGLADAGNFSVAVDDYDRFMNSPKREPRLDCLCEVTCRLDGESLTGVGLDISSGGIFIDSKEHFPVGKVLDMEFSLDENSTAPIYCRGAVTWINERPDPIKPNYPNGFGICFLEMDEPNQRAIKAFIESEHGSTESDDA